MADPSGGAHRVHGRITGFLPAGQIRRVVVSSAWARPKIRAVVSPTDPFLTMLGFSTESDGLLHKILSDAGAIAASTYVLFPFLLSLILLLHPESRRRWTNSHSLPTLLALAIGLLLAATDVGLSIIPSSFPLILMRRIIAFLSRASLVIGTVLLYRPGSPQDMTRIYSGTTSSPESGKRTPRPPRLQISGPVQESFKHMDTNQTRDFHHEHAKKFGWPTNTQQAVAPGRVVLRTVRAVSRGAFLDTDVCCLAKPARDAPVLSFTPSVSDLGLLRELQSTITRPSTPIHNPPRPLVHNPTCGADTPTRKYSGSIYAASDTSLRLSDVPPTPKLRSPARARIAHPFTATASDDGITLKTIPRYRAEERTLTVADAFPRVNSIKRKPVPTFDSDLPGLKMSSRPPRSPGRQPSNRRVRLTRRETDPSQAVVPEIYSPTSIYSTVEENLFFKTPTQSPDDHPSPLKEANVLSEEADVKILSSLSRLQRDAGIVADPRRLQGLVVIVQKEGEEEDGEDGQSISSIAFSFTSLNTLDETPRAERQEFDFGERGEAWV
ncbi:hypothetical protein P7C73_g3803, partial [Tremellales sp. Uapishka_1]